MLIHCKFTSELWAGALDEMRLSWVVPRSARDLFATDLEILLARGAKSFGKRSSMEFVCVGRKE